jgi:Mg2+ and Co2+ transporter CorA
MKKVFYILLAIVILYIVYVIYVLTRKRKVTIESPSGQNPKVITLNHPDSNYSNIDDDTYRALFADITKMFSKEVAELVEKIYRLETAHFKSEQYKNTGSAGMLSFGTVYPYGWYRLMPFWLANPQWAPTGVGYTFKKSGQTYEYLKFPNFGGFYTLSYFLSSNRPGRWYSTDPEKQKEYEQKLEKIQTKYV